MANRYWEGSVSTDPTNGSNYSPTGVLAAGDVLYFTNSATQAVIVGGDLSSGGTVLFAGLYIGQAFEGDLGSSGSPLVVDFQSGKKAKIQGSASGKKCWLEFGGSNSVTVTVASWGTISVGTETTHGVHIDETIIGTIGNFYISGGDVYIESGSAIGSMHVMGGTLRCDQGSSASIANLYVYNPLASVYWGGSIGTSVELNSGLLNFTGTSGPTGSIEVTGGILQWYADGGNIGGLLKLRNGTADFSKAKQKPSINSTEIYDSSSNGSTVLNLNNGVGGVTFTSAPAVVVGNPTIHYPPDATISISG